MSSDRRAFALNDSEAILRQLLLELDDLRLRTDHRTAAATLAASPWRVAEARDELERV